MCILWDVSLSPGPGQPDLLPGDSGLTAFYARDCSFPEGLYSDKWKAFFASLLSPKLDHKEGWVPKNWCFLTVALEKTLESPLDCKKIKPVNPKGNQSWIFIGRTQAKTEALILWPPDAKNWLTGKDLMLGKIEGRGEGGDRRWNGWVASPTQWTWIWANSVR